jgi:hypothetical protein
MSAIGYRDHTLIGLPDQVANVIRNHHTAGTLISLSAPAPVSATDPRIRVALRLVDTTAPTTGPDPVRVASLRTHITDRVRPYRTRRTRRVIAITTAAATVAAAAVIGLVAYLVAQLVAFIAAHLALIVGVVLLVAIATAFLLRTGGDRRRHCPGC